MFCRWRIIPTLFRFVPGTRSIYGVANGESQLRVPVPCWLVFCAVLLSVAPDAVEAAVSYDSDGDGLIEISTLAQLNAIRWDLDGDGAVDSGTNRVAYSTAFPDAAASMGCAATCIGYELVASLTFDENGDGRVTAADGGYWNGGAGWLPIENFAATFEGNGHTIARLYISRSTGGIGLFGGVSAGGQVRNVAVRDVAVTGSGDWNSVGGLVGIVASYATKVTGSGRDRMSSGGSPVTQPVR